MFLFVILLSLVIYILVESFRKPGLNKTEKYDYKCFLLTLPVIHAKTRQTKFLQVIIKMTIPIETIYGINTKKMKNVAREYENIDRTRILSKRL